MATTTEVDIEQLYKQLDEIIKADDEQGWPEGLKITDQILSVIPDDETALHCKISFLIQNDRFDEALSLKFPSSCVFEQAYCNYRTNNLKAALSLLSGVADPKPGRVLRLLGQVYYRLEDYSNAIKIFEKAAQDPGSNQAEINTNLSAAYAASGTHVDRVHKLRTETTTFEMLYNEACAAISGEDFAHAEALLIKSSDTCRQQLIEQGEDEETIESELVLIHTQLAFVRQQLGRVEEALSAYMQILASKSGDVAVNAVATNNLVAGRGARELGDSAKKLASIRSAEVKLNSKQKEACAANRALVFFFLNKFDKCREEITEAEKSFPQSDSLVTVSAALLMKEKKQEEAIKLLNNFISSSKSCWRAAAMLTQIYISAGQHAEAIKVLQGLNESTPGVVGTIVALSNASGDASLAAKALDSAMASAKGEARTKLLHAQAASKLKLGQYADASQAYLQLVQSNPDDQSLVSALVLAAAHADPAVAEKYSSKLMELPGAKSDVRDLESMKAPKKVATKTASATAAATQAKKKRKIRWPKGFDPLAPNRPVADPERWIPKRERKDNQTSRRRRGTRKETTGKGTQGSTNADAGRLAMSEAPSTASEKQTTSTTATTAAAQKQKQQKKKGGKSRF